MMCERSEVLDPNRGLVQLGRIQSGPVGSSSSSADRSSSPPLRFWSVRQLQLPVGPTGSKTQNRSDYQNLLDLAGPVPVRFWFWLCSGPGGRVLTLGPDPWNVEGGGVGSDGSGL